MIEPIELTEQQIRDLIAKNLNSLDQYQDINGDLIISFPATKELEKQKKSYYQAHQVGNHILNLSKKNGKHDINVTLELMGDTYENIAFVVRVKKDDIEKLREAQNNSLKKNVIHRSQNY